MIQTNMERMLKLKISLVVPRIGQLNLHKKNCTYIICIYLIIHYSILLDLFKSRELNYSKNIYKSTVIAIIVKTVMFRRSERLMIYDNWHFITLTLTFYTLNEWIQNDLTEGTPVLHFYSNDTQWFFLLNKDDLDDIMVVLYRLYVILYKYACRRVLSLRFKWTISYFFDILCFACNFHNK